MEFLVNIKFVWPDSITDEKRKELREPFWSGHAKRV